MIERDIISNRLLPTRHTWCRFPSIIVCLIFLRLCCIHSRKTKIECIYSRNFQLSKDWISQYFRSRNNRQVAAERRNTATWWKRTSIIEQPLPFILQYFWILLWSTIAPIGHRRSSGGNQDFLVFLRLIDVVIVG